MVWRWVVVLVLAVGPYVVSGHGLSRFELLFPWVAVGAALWAANRRPDLWAPLVVLTAIAMAVLGQQRVGAVLVLLMVVPVVLWGLVLAVVRPPGLLPVQRRALTAALVPVVCADVLWVWRHNPVRAGWFAGAAGAMAVAMLASPDLAARVDRYMAPARRTGSALLRVAAPVQRGLAMAGEFLSTAASRLRTGAGRMWEVWSAPTTTGEPVAHQIAEKRSPGHGERRGGLRGSFEEYRWPVMAWFVVYFVWSKVMHGAFQLWTGRPLAEVPVWPSFIDPAGRAGWGTGDYWQIANGGYDSGEALEAAFPGLALAMRALSGPVGDLAVAGVLIISAAGLAATMLLWTWMIRRSVPRRERKVATLLFLLYPYSFLIAGVAYSDILLVMLVLAAFVLIDSGRPVLAGVVGAAATLTRPNALPLIGALVVMELARSRAVELPERRPAPAPGPVALARTWVEQLAGTRVHLGRLRPAQLGVLLSIGGVGAYSLWLHDRTGDPLYFLTAQEHYGHTSVTSLSTWLKVGFVNSPETYVHNWVEVLNEVLAFVFVLVAVLLLRSIARRLGWGYATFALGVILIAWVGPHGFAPGGRVLLPVLPLVAVVASRWLVDRPRLLVPLLVAFAAISISFAAVFPAGGRLWGEW